MEATAAAAARRCLRGAEIMTGKLSTYSLLLSLLLFLSSSCFFFLESSRTTLRPLFIILSLSLTLSLSLSLSRDHPSKKTIRVNDQ